TNAPLQEAMRRLHEQMVLPNSALQETVRRIGEMVAATNAPLQEVRRLHKQTANPRALEQGSGAAAIESRPAIEQRNSSSGRAAHQTSTEQPAQHRVTDDARKDTGGKPDSEYDQRSN
ncbi:hypothetical protein, partial [Streptomyces sp. SR-10]|uniref:hypothetical protein n=1 Tax=Streptomyces sp. SR-10 TaxID=3416442 RepID=UPI003CF005F3